MGFLSRALWLVVVYWVTIGLVVMILGAHQFHLKVAANAAVNPATSLTIGELIRQRNIYRELQDAADSLQAEAKTKASEVAKFQREAILAIGEQEKLGAAVAIAVQQLAASVVIPRSTQGEKGDAPTLVPDNLGRRDLAQWARGHIRTDVSRKLNETLVKEETKFAEAEAIRFIAQKQADVATARLAVLRLELIPQAEKNLKNFLEGLTARPAPPAGAPPPTNGGSVLGLLYELDSFTNLSFLWFGLVEPMKFVTLPGSVLTLLLALSMGALGSTLFVTGEFFGVGASRPFAWFLFRPFLGMITALAVFVVFKAGQLTMAGGAPSSNSEIDLNPFLVSF
ncbi:MAG TPA: hypothetical protein VEC14_05325, partial [Reyranellaceae bacterium]|nr:hypothetical protein [Reyranellaceae bacterium]